jgi:hypothetical protein
MFVGRTKLNVLSAGIGVESSIANSLSLLGMLYRLFHIWVEQNPFKSRFTLQGSNPSINL